MKQYPRCQAKHQQESKPSLFDEEKFFSDEKLFGRDELERTSNAKWYPADVKGGKHNLWDDNAETIESHHFWEGEEDKAEPFWPGRDEEMELEHLWENESQCSEEDQSAVTDSLWEGQEDEEHEMLNEEKGCEGKKHPEPCHHHEDCKVIREKSVYCKEEKNYYHKVKHIIPVICKKVENHHYNHEYIIKKEVIKKEHHYDHGKRDEDWCKVAGCCNNHKDDCGCEE